jgi:hypothetical protein
MFSYNGTRILGLLLGNKGGVFLQNSGTHPATQHNDPKQMNPQTRTTLKSLIGTHYLKLYFHFLNIPTLTLIICVFSGGMDNIENASLNKYKNGMVGCISDLILDTDYPVKLVQMSTAGKNIKHCG